MQGTVESQITHFLSSLKNSSEEQGWLFWENTMQCPLCQQRDQWLHLQVDTSGRGDVRECWDQTSGCQWSLLTPKIRPEQALNANGQLMPGECQMSSKTVVTTYPALPKADFVGEVPLLNRNTPWKTHHCRGQPAEPDSPLMQTGSRSSRLSYYLWARHRQGQPKCRCFYGWAPWWSYPKIGELKREMLICTCAWHMHLYGREGCSTTVALLFKEPKARRS